MSRLAAAVAALALASAACAPGPPSGRLSPDPRLDLFLREVETNLEAHAWDRVLSLADPEHRRVQVEEVGIPEPQYVAELLGLHREGNDIGRGEGVGWEELVRLPPVRLARVERREDGYTLRGTVLMADGEVLELEGWIVRRDGRFRLTGGVG
jgi:hypothetical protein